jgi:hypothetical protein
MSRSLLPHRLRKLRSLGAGELAWLLRAQAMLLWAAVVVRTRPAGRLISARVVRSAEPAVTDVRREEARRIAQAVRRAADHGVFRPACLVRSVALQRMLQFRGISGSRIHIGVSLEGGQFVAHAWVEWGGQVLGDVPAYVQTFAPLCDVDVAGAC